MITIIVTACNFLMATHPGSGPHCRNFELVYAENISLISCLMKAQPQIAKDWYPWHPQWQIQKITCQARDKLAKEEEDI